MRRPDQKAFLWFLLAACGGAGVLLASQFFDQLGEVWSLVIGVPSVAVILFGVVYGIMASLSAYGEWRLRHGINVIARWQVPPDEWEAFRAYDKRRGAEQHGLTNDFTPNPAEGRSVEVVFGPRQAMVDGSYHPLGRWAIPQLMWVGWQQPPDAPECLELGLLHPAGKSSTLPMTLRVPVPRAARDDGVRMFHHFKARAPVSREGIAFRRPKLVIGWCIALTLIFAAVGGVGWLMYDRGDRSDLTVVMMVGGLMAAIAAALVTAIISVAVWARNRRG
jgi:hypothetical protein